MKRLCILLCAVLLSGGTMAQDTWQKDVRLQNGVWPKQDSVSKNIRDDYYYRLDIKGESYLDIEMALISMAGGSSSFIDMSFYRLNADSTLEKIWMSGGSSSDRAFGSRVGDTLRWRFTKRSDGTYFLRVNRASTAASSFKVRYLWDGGAGYPNDPEPNNDYFHAVEIKNGVTAYGHIGFENHDSSIQDFYDCYKFTVRNDCDVKLEFHITPCPGTNGDNIRLDMDGWQFLYGDSTFSNVFIGGWRNDNNYGVFDTVKRVRFKGLSAGTYYFRIYPYVGFGYYNLKLTVDEYNVPDDPEENDNYLQAVPLVPGKTTYGHVGFFDKDRLQHDYYDCYKFTVEKDCDVRLLANIRPKGEGDCRFEMDGWQIRYGDSIFGNTPVGGWRNDNNYGVFDTVKRYRYMGLSAGTYYFRVSPSVGLCTYDLKLDTFNYGEPSDAEPNDEFIQALPVKPGDTMYGHAGFYDQTRMEYDYNDAYKLTVDKDCNISAVFNIRHKGEGDCRFDWSSLHYMMPDSSFVYYRGLNGDYQSVWDTLKRARSMGVGKGTYFFRITPSVGIATYDFNISLEYPEIGSDAEPNDTWAQATSLREGDTAFGHIGYDGAMDSTGYYQDKEDWYIVTLPSNGSINVLSQCYPGSGHGSVLDDKLGLYFKLYQVDEGVVDEIGSLSGPSTWEKVDTMTYNWKTTLGKGTYFLQVSPRGGYGQYKFVYETRPAPVADFDFVQRINDKGQTEVCFINRTTGNATKYYWKYDGSSWNYTYNANPTVVYSTSGVREVMLIAYGTEGNDTVVKYVEVNGLQRVESPKAGQGDVTLKFYAGGIQKKDTFLLEKGGMEYAGTLLREVRKGCVELRFHLHAAPVGKYSAIIRHSNGSEMRLDNAFELEAAVEPEIYVDLLGLDKMLYNRWQDYTAVIGNKGNVDAYNRTLWIVTPHDSNCHIQLRNVSFIMPKGDTLQWVKDIPPYLIYDSLEPGGGPVRVYPLMFSVIPAGSEVEVHFRMASDKSERIGVFTTDPFVTESLLKDYDSYESCVAWTIAKYVAEKAVGFLLDEIPGAGCVKDVIKFTYQTTESTVEGNIQAGSLAWSVATTAWSCAKDFVGPLKAYKMTCDIIDLMIDIADNYSADKDCQKYKKKNGKNKNVRAVSSMDPNEISGPAGFGEYNDVCKQDFSYTIMFENKASASAPAQEVVVTDTLDRTKFDFSGIRFNSFSIGDSIYTVQQSGLAFATELDWDSVIVRISGRMDTVSGVVSWQFVTLDKNNRGQVSDPDDGFLKPNKNAPEGEGSVSFTIPLKAHVKDGDVVENRAVIVFDANAPISTNIYSNRIDENRPSSAIARVAEAEGGKDEYTLYFSGSDNGSGVFFYSLSVSVNGGDTQLLSGHITGDSYTMPLHKDSVYRFFLLATDSLFHQEEVKSAPDLVLNGDGIACFDEDNANTPLRMRLNPNPARQWTNITFAVRAAGETCVEIYNMLGVRVAERNLGYREAGMHQEVLDLSALPQGLYAVRLRCGQHVCNGKVAVR